MLINASDGWHVVSSQEIELSLSLSSLTYGEYDYVNEIRDRWLEGRQQERTVGEARTIGIDLVNKTGTHAQLLFPDHSGETFDGLWITRTCSKSVADQIKQRGGTLLFLRQNLTQPMPLTEVMATEDEMRSALPEAIDTTVAPPQMQEWRAEVAPDQVKLVDTLQVLADQFSLPGEEKLAILVSAWDRAPAGITPEEFVSKEMPLLYQYLQNGRHNFDIHFYGVSAQGGEYLEDNHEGDCGDELTDLLTLENATSRINLIHGSEQSHDLTEPINWLMT